MKLASTTEIVTDLKAGRMVILVDEEDRENEGDLLIAAEFVTPEAINFMARFGRGLICLTLTEERCERLNLPLMTQRNGAQHGTAFTVSIEAANGVTTGISTTDRARTISVAIAADARAEDIVQPGHIFPLKARRGGVLVRPGHTEAGCDLTTLAGLTPAAVICEIIRDDGQMARLPDLIEFALRHDLKVGTIADLVQFRCRTEPIVERVAERTVHTAHGSFRSVLYRDTPTGTPHIALFRGTPSPELEIPVSVLETPSTFDLLEMQSPDSGWTLGTALKEMAERETGVIVLLNCADSIERIVGTAVTQDKSAGVFHREDCCTELQFHGVASRILGDMGVVRLTLFSDSRVRSGLISYGLDIVEFFDTSYR